jgi:hemolysin D
MMDTTTPQTANSQSGKKALSVQGAHMPLLEFYSPSAGLLAANPRGPARSVTWIMAALLLSTGLAAGLIPIDKVVTAQGRVVAVEATVVVQPLETAIVREIDVQEGQRVVKGQLLAKLDPTFTTSDKTALGSQVRSLQAEVDRLQAEADGRDYSPKDSSDPAAVLQSVMFIQRRSEHQSRMDNYARKMEGLQATLQKAAGDVVAYNEREGVASTVESKRNELQHMGWGSQLNALQAEDQRMEVQRNLASSKQTVRSAAQDLQAMQAEARAFDQDWHAKISQDLTEAQRKLAEATGNLTKADLRSNLVELRAPVDATVLTRAKVSVGSVLQSGDQFLSLVPEGAAMEVEANVAGGDAGFVHDGNQVTLKFDTFPYTQYGGAIGTVRTMSPDSFASQAEASPPVRGAPQAPQQQAAGQNATFYRTRISMDSVSLHDTPQGFHIVPGMPVTADVMVGKRTVLSYLFSRALPIAMDGMREP